jgi:predicted nucleic acid-binding Zn ribbon protein
MSDLKRSNRADLPSCPRCSARMVDVVSIAPLGDEPGLIAYECPQCGYVTSVLQQPERHRH